MTKGEKNDYSTKKKYAEQKMQLSITTYENGQEKIVKMPLCDVPMVVDDKVADLVWLVRKVREQGVMIQDLIEQNKAIPILKESIKQLTEIMKGEL